MNTKISEPCHCSSDGLYLSTRAVSGIVACGIILGAGVFVAGYFYGKKDTIEHLMSNNEQQVFGDHIYASLCQLYNQPADNPMPETVAEQVTETSTEVTPEPVQTAAEATVSAPVALAPAKEQVAASSAAKQPVTTALVPEIGKNYYAQLVGFGSQKIAQQCHDRLAKKGFQVIIKPRGSTSSKGKKVTWYQLVTPQYANKQELDQLVDRIAKEEKLKDIRIVAS